jgi:hypothetical protein
MYIIPHTLLLLFTQCHAFLPSPLTIAIDNTGFASFAINVNLAAQLHYSTVTLLLFKFTQFHACRITILLS